MNKTVLASLLTALTVAPAYAANMYAGIKGGKSSYIITGLTDSSPNAYGVFGGYIIDPNLSVEAEYTNLGSINPSSATAIGASALFYYPGNEPFSLFAKLSYSSSAWKTPSSVQHNSSFTHGLGCQYDASHNMSVRFSWERYMIGNQVAINVDMLSIAAMVRF